MERHRMAEHTRYERLYGLFLAYAALLALFGLIMDTPVNILRGLSSDWCWAIRPLCCQDCGRSSLRRTR